MLCEQVSLGSRAEGQGAQHVPSRPYHIPTPHQGQNKEEAWGRGEDGQAMGRCVGQPQGSCWRGHFSLQAGESFHYMYTCLAWVARTTDRL